MFINFGARYERGSRSLADNLLLTKEALQQRVSMATSRQVDQEEEEDYDVPEEMEEVIGTRGYTAHFTFHFIFVLFKTLYKTFCVSQ